MGFLSNTRSMFEGLTEFFGFFREFFTAMPLVIQVLVYFSFGGLVLLLIVQMFRKQ